MLTWINDTFPLCLPAIRYKRKVSYWACSCAFTMPFIYPFGSKSLQRKVAQWIIALPQKRMASLYVHNCVNRIRSPFYLHWCVPIPRLLLESYESAIARMRTDRLLNSCNLVYGFVRHVQKYRYILRSLFGQLGHDKFGGPCPIVDGQHIFVKIDGTAVAHLKHHRAPNADGSF